MSKNLSVLSTNQAPSNIVFTLNQSVNGIENAGMTKLINKFTQFLLTNYGSVPCRPDYGTRFLTMLKGANITPENVRIAAVLALNACNAKLPAEELSTDDPSECYGDAELDHIEYADDSVLIYFKIYNTVGESTIVGVEYA